MLTNENYYQDKTHITNSMLSDFVHYEKWNRILTPETYYARHITKALKFEPTDAMICWTIADRYFAEWPQILEEYPVKSKRSWDNPNEITNSMKDKVDWFIKSFNAFKSFQEFISHSDCRRWDSCESIRTKEITLPSWRVVSMKCKLDFVNDKQKLFIDQKTCANADTLYWELQFRWVPNIYHRYIRQMSIYHHMTWYSPALAIADDESRMLYIPIRKDIIDKALEIYLQDLDELMEYYDSNWANLNNKDPFKEFPPQEEQEIF